MKKLSIFSTVLFIISTLIFAKNDINLLRIPEPGAALIKKRRVLINLDDIKSILKKNDNSGKTLNIELATSGDFVIARLAKIKNNRVSYQHKIIDTHYLLVNFGKEEYKNLLRKILNKPGSLRYQLIFSDKSNKVVKSFPLTFSKLPDLSVVLKYPVNIAPGNPIQDKLKLIVKNNGMETSVKSEAEIVMSKKFNIPTNFRVALNSSDLIRFKNGIVKIPALQPGEEKEITPSMEIIVPTNIPEGRYFIASLIDPGDNLVELDEGNNLFEGFVIVETFEPKKITVPFPDTELVYYPANFKLEIISNGLVISSGKEWRKCNVKPNIYQIKHASWINFFWEINVVNRTVWKITGAAFCKRGGTEKEIKVKVINFGGTRSIPPGKFKLLLKDTKFIYAPKLKHLTITSHGSQIAHPSFWEVCKIKPLKYHFKFTTWDKVILELDPATKSIRKIPANFMCKKTDSGENLNLNVEIKN